MNLFCLRLEENEKLVLTPFEKNLDIWRQLWRVVERSDLVTISVGHNNFTSLSLLVVFVHMVTLICFSAISQLVMVVDARNPLFYRCPDLEVIMHCLINAFFLT